MQHFYTDSTYWMTNPEQANQELAEIKEIELELMLEDYQLSTEN